MAEKDLPDLTDEEVSRLRALLTVDEDSEDQSYASTLARLRDLQALLAQREPFAPGDIVFWKSSALKNKRWPKVNQPGIVLEVLDEPFIDASKDSASAYFREQLDIVVAFFDEDDQDDLLAYHYDSRRLTKTAPR